MANNDEITFDEDLEPPPVKSTQRKLMTDIITGGTAASLACVFSNPFEVVKTRLQLQGEMANSAAQGRVYKGLIDAFMKIPREEGVLAIQKGLVPGMVYQFFMNGARLGIYPTLKRLLNDDGSHSPMNVLRQIGAGATSGAIGAVIGSPFFMVKCRLQAMSKIAKNSGTLHANQYDYKGMVDGLVKVYKEEGMSGWFRGIDGAVPRVMVGSASQLATYETVKQRILALGYLHDGILCHFSSSMVSGIVVTTIMNPFDVVSTRLYTQPQGAKRIYSGPVDCFIKTARAEGLGGFFKGWTAHYARLGPHTVLCLVFWEQVRNLAHKFGF
ncbi:hypothetical protein GUITHDRAFT_162598 [Guillardia theta CCMP2712]|uniref:Mitochondrial carrier n=1 Tax=Guillardia theta (strain CCMP2712) TaxID=905079 RepID=L1JH72_GUITC|nr:hypothetical protein GUITHDRAFT_162598 [Guillardia theta CCMP2712]EKX47831.1 hypothetical protein GUITHDRAFT_162598 [Guillardia theta CCMP2712]|eukprot:XP_005834811.1 hypothetical protein GUITHDRAFT_162598 [Guillardia theta CCMP2712]